MTGLKRAALCVSLLALPALASAQSLDLTVVGGSDELKAELRAAMSMTALLAGDKPTPQSLLAAAQADYARLVAELYDGGRFSPSVSIRVDGQEAANLSPFDTPARINKIDVTVEPGPRFRFGRATIAPLAEGTVLPESYAPGARAGTQPVRDAARAAISGWRDVGHAKARIADQTISANHPKRELNAELSVAPGPKLRFGSIIVTGNDGVRRTRIREIAGIPDGGVFQPQEIDEAERRLRQTGVFRSVAITEADDPNPDGTLDLSVQVAEQKLRRFGFGAEASTQEGAKFSAFWLHRNYFFGGERLRLDAEVSGIDADGSGIDYKLGLTYGRPATFTPDTEFFLTGVLERLDEPGFQSDQARVTAGLAHRFNDKLSGRFALGYRYADTKDAFGSRKFSLLTSEFGATYDTRNDTFNPTTGYFLSASAMPFLGLDETENGVRFTSDARTYVGLGADNRFVLAGRLQLGTVWGPSLAETVPDFLFYSGGGGTVRGQNYQSLGVTADNGELTGGQSFAAVSAELRAKVGESFGLVGFYDAGFVTDASGFGGNDDWHAGAGLGIRYDTGIGPLRFDIATPVSGDNAGKGIELYIGIGQAF